MKKIKSRARSVLLIAALAVIGLGFYLVKYLINGGEWVSAPFNQTVYNSGILSVGALADRNDLILADINNGSRVFAEKADIRTAALHVTGDKYGNIGTGALKVFARELMGYNFITGAYSVRGVGNEVRLSVDANLNLTALEALKGRRGTVMVMNYKTGEIITMVSTPTFDPMEPPAIRDGDLKLEGVYINRGLSASYTPGSTFKLLTAAAAIENIDGISERIFSCDGVLKVGNDSVTCPRAHGEVDLEDALVVSCNTTFGQLSIELGADVLAEYTGKYGLSERISIDRITTAKGNFDKAEPDTADLAWSGIGQYNNLVCPAAMLRFVGAAANNGRAAKMSMLNKSGANIFSLFSSERLIKSETAEKLGVLMRAGYDETERSGSFPGLIMHGKTGTAQVGSDAEPHAWFTGYITNEGYPLAFVVLVENGGGGAAVAGPIANAVLQAAIG